MYGIKERDVIRVKVKYCDDEKEPQIKKFAIDPRLTNFDVLIGLLVKGLNIKRDFVIHYLATDDFGEQFYLPLLSDWDLDAAILTASDPILRLKVNLKHKEKVDWRQSYKLYNLSFEDNDEMSLVLADLEEWDIVVPGEAPVKLGRNNLTSKSLSNLFKSINVNEGRIDKISSGSLMGYFSSQVEKTVNSINKVFSNNKLNELTKPLKSPMSDIEFRNYMDNIGRIIQPEEFRRSVYMGGLEHSLRKVGWRLLLNVYPIGLTGRQRLNLLEKKTKDYQSLKHSWKLRFKMGKLTEQEMAQIALVSVDVIRTDKNINFYSGEKNQLHVNQLFDILATYCIYHPSVGYYQGMSDLASPLLFVQGDEAVAYLCFCSLMQRLAANFTSIYISGTNTTNCSCNSRHQSSNDLKNINSTNGHHLSSSSVMLTKLQHLNDLLKHLDPELANFLHQKHLSDYYFAHRWLLLEMKREFAFIDSLHLMEVQWAALPNENFPSRGNNNNTLISIDQSNEGDGNVSGVPLVEHSLICPDAKTNNTSTSAVNGSTNRVRCYAVRDMSLVCSLIGPQYAPTSSLTTSPLSSLTTITADALLRESLDIINTENLSNGDLSNDVWLESSTTTESSSKSNPMSPAKTNSNGTINNYSRRSSFSDDDDDEFRTPYPKKFQSPIGNNSNHGGVIIEGSKHTDHSSSNTGSTTSLTTSLTPNDSSQTQQLLPPDQLGLGNPLLLFICASLLQENRDAIIGRVSEVSDLLLMFQRQRHNLHSVLNRARSQYDKYLRDQEVIRRRLNEFPELQLSM